VSSLRVFPTQVRKALADINVQKWRALLLNCFGCEPAPPLTLEQARKLAIDMVDAMQDEQLLKQVRFLYRVYEYIHVCFPWNPDLDQSGVSE